VDELFEPRRLLAQMSEAARNAGEIALDFFRSGERTRAAVDYKSGGSPVTEADYAVDRFLEGALRPTQPEFGWLSEEKTDDLDRLSRRAVFIVDPIDGTRGFVSGDPRWAVCVALVVSGEPILGVLRLPALDKTFAALRGRGATLNGEPIRVSNCDSLENARIAAPQRLLEALMRTGAPIQPQPKIPSLAFRIAQVACGALDVGLASTGAHDWDIAAADLVLREAGGVLYDAVGNAPIYNARDPRHGVLAASPVSLKSAMIDALGVLGPSPVSSMRAPTSS
jgi:myo-inositol-1(or 4)-monophosphatase